MSQRAPVLDASVDEVVRIYEREGPIPISDEAYLRIALENPNTLWELHHGVLVEKPGMSFQHYDVSFYLGFQLAQQLDRALFRVRVNGGRLHRPGGTYFVPDVMVIPTAILGPDIHRPDVPETHDVPLPFVAEAWSPSTGRYDVNTKIPEYKRRGDLEIWRLHPFERTLTVWRRRPDGDDDQTVYHGGLVEIASLPGVTINLDELFV